MKVYFRTSIIKKGAIMLMVEDVDLTPNPHALKFILNEKLLNNETRQYADKASAQNDEALACIGFQMPRCSYESKRFLRYRKI